MLPPEDPEKESIEEVLTHEFSEAFIQKMRNRMYASFCKYGAVADGYPENVDAMGTLGIRTAKYMETGNLEYLVDVANMAMIEFMFPRKRAFWKAEDSASSPGRVDNEGDLSQKTNLRLRGEDTVRKMDPEEEDAT